MKRILLVLFVLSFALAVGGSRPGVAAAGDLFFSEYIEGSSNNKALEIYNGTGAAIDLAAGEYLVQMYFNGNSSAGLTINLEGVVADGDVFVLANSAAVQEILDQADQTNGAGWFNGDDAVVLRKGGSAGAAVDSIGQIGFDPGSQWGTGDVSTQDNTLRRQVTVCAGDTNAEDAFDPALEWDGFPQNTFDGLGNHTAACSGGPRPAVINEFVFNHTGSDTYEYVEVYGSADSDYSALTILEIEGDGSGAGTVDGVFAVGSTDAGGFWTTGFLANEIENGTVSLLLVEEFTGSAGADLDTDNDGALETSPWSAIIDSVAVTDGDSGDQTYADVVLAPGFDGGSFTVGGASRIPNGTDSNSAGDWMRNDFDGAGLPGFVGSPQLGEAYNTPGAENAEVVPPPFGECGDEAFFIHEIQGSGAESPLQGYTVPIEGVVVGDFQEDDGDFFNTDLTGFYVQEEDSDADGDPSTSEGIFVYGWWLPDVQIGDVVRVQGNISEYSGLTEITGSEFALCGQATLPTISNLSLPVNELSDLERYEGMYVQFPDPLVISEYYNFDRYGEILLCNPPDGYDRLFQPTAVYDPYTPEQLALAEMNAESCITLDDGRSSQNPDPARHPNGEEFTLENRFRGGDLVDDTIGVLDDRFGLYRVQPTEGADYAAVNLRPEVPEVGGNIQVASFNVLNYFLTIDQGRDYWICGPNQDMECRGADTPEEFQRQRAKILAALGAINADVFGLIEMENTTGVEPMADIVAGLNEDSNVEGSYAYVDTGVIGTDAIKVGFIYRSDTVTPVGDYAVLDDPAFTNPFNAETDRNRPALAQTFMDNETGGVFTVVVNHLKSKGSGCGEGDDDPVQGSCNLTRTVAAQVLVEWLAGDPTGSGDPDFLIIGDLNSYDKEDPIYEILNGADNVVGNDDDYTDLLYAFQGEYAYTYLFSGQLGYLDYAIASQAMLDEITGVAAWHINADEPDILDYDTSFKQDAQDALYEPNAYRSSDHDPVIVGLNVCDEIAPEASATVTPDLLWPPNHKYVEVVATVEATDNFDPDPTITLVSVTSNEPDDGLGDGDTPDDIVIVDDYTFELRAERSALGEGRIYTITYEVTDDCGNSTIVSATVTVPLSQGPQDK